MCVCVRLCASVRVCARLCASVRVCVRLCASLRVSARLCASLRVSARLCASLRVSAFALRTGIDLFDFSPQLTATPGFFGEQNLTMVFFL